MSKRTTIPGARSYRRGELSTTDLLAMADQFSHPALRRAARALVQEIEDSAVDALLVDGDLIIHGNLDTGDHGEREDGEPEATLLVVRGDLVVHGLYRDACNDAPDLVCVLGELRAEHVISAAYLEVQGNLRVAGIVVGDYNDGAAKIGGDLAARLFAPADHGFAVAGAIQVDYLIKGSHGLERGPAPVPWADVPLASLGLHDEDRDAAAIIARLRAAARAPG